MFTDYIIKSLTRIGKNLLPIVILFYCSNIIAQNINFEKIKKSKPIKLSGSIAANSVFYNSNQNSSRLPITYFTQGSLNLSLYGFSIPISYSYSNLGDNLNYQSPINLNRISLHPKYKWITAHIGHISSNFSNYSLSNHQYTGVEIELTPNESPISFNIMGGQLLKATQNANIGNTQANSTFSRFGYGLKSIFKKNNYMIEAIGFYAKDKPNSLIINTSGITPQENLVLNLKSIIKLNQNYQVSLEYASSALTTDTNSQNAEFRNLHPTSLFFNTKSTTSFQSAFNAQINYSYNSFNIGLNYERIDPNYRTLGTYFFNNDFEDITINIAKAFFKNKLSLNMNLGRRQDNLNNNKINKTNRTVAAINMTASLNKKLSINASYSNFNTFTNTDINQFQTINDNDLTDEDIERLNFTQLSQTASTSIIYNITANKNKTQNINFNYNLNTAVNKENDIVRIGNESTFHNFNFSHAINLIPRDLSISSSINTTYNTIGNEESLTWGPNINLIKHFFKKTLSARSSISYNSTNTDLSKTNVLSLRIGANYKLKKVHQFNVNTAQLFRNSDRSKLNETTFTLSYNYNFGIIDSKKVTFSKIDKNDIVNIHYKETAFKGHYNNVYREIIALHEKQDLQFLPERESKKVTKLITQLEKPKNLKQFKKTGTKYLVKLDKYDSFKKQFQSDLEIALKILRKESKAVTRRIEARIKYEEFKKGNISKRKYKKKLAKNKTKISTTQKLQKHLEFVAFINEKGTSQKVHNTYITAVYKKKVKKKEFDTIDYLIRKITSDFNK